METDAAAVDAAVGLTAAYVHVPFCSRVCPYCDFAVVAGRDDLADRYVAALIGEIRATEPLGDRPLDAVYIGGGTPSRLPAESLGALLEALEQQFGLADDAERSLEANPEDWTPQVAEQVREAGFDRVSLGAQSMDAVVLAALGRSHRPDDAGAAVAAARAADFRSTNVDLIFGTPGETLASWEEGVVAALDAGVDHLSTYALTVERGTELSRAVAAGAPAPDADDQADKFEAAAALASAAGLEWYETSNHARPGHGCVYNLVAWAQGDYLAFGNGAHRHRDGVRSWNLRRVDRYLEAVESGADPTAGKERLRGWERERERVMLGLRRRAGVVAGRAGSCLLRSPGGRRLVEAGVIAAVGDRVVVTRPLLGDEVGRTLLALDEPDC